MYRYLILIFVYGVWCVGSSYSQDWYPNTTGRVGGFRRAEPLPSVVLKNGVAMIGGKSPLLDVDFPILIVSGGPKLRYLAFPTTDGEAPSARVVEMEIEACRWTIKRQLVGSGRIPGKNGFPTLKMSEYFTASDGPFKDCFLCIDERNYLVLKKDPQNAIVRSAEYEDNKGDSK